MFWHVSVCLFTPQGRGYPGQVQLGRVPRPGPAGGGTPPQVPPSHQTWPGGYPTSGTPSQTWQGGTPPWVPPVRPGQGVSHSGTPRQTWLGGTLPGGTPPWVPPHQTWPRGYPAGGTPPWVPPTPIRPGRGVTPPWVTDGVLDTPRSVCLLRSRRRTFLFQCKISSALFKS